MYFLFARLWLQDLFKIFRWISALFPRSQSLNRRWSVPPSHIGLEVGRPQIDQPKLRAAATESHDMLDGNDVGYGLKWTKDIAMLWVIGCRRRPLRQRVQSLRGAGSNIHWGPGSLSFSKSIDFFGDFWAEFGRPCCVSVLFPWFTSFFFEETFTDAGSCF